MGHLQLTLLAMARHLFHRAPAAVASVEVLRGVGAGRIPAQDRLHRRHRLKDYLKVDPREFAQTGDIVRNGNPVGGFVMLFAPHQVG